MHRKVLLDSIYHEEKRTYQHQFQKGYRVKNLELKKNINDSLTNNFMSRYTEIYMKLKIYLMNKSKLMK